MSRRAAFLGELADLHLHWPDRTLRVEVRLPLQDFDALSGRIGLPPAAAEHGTGDAAPAVALLPCRRVRHPDREEDALADAALTLLQALLESGQLRLDVRQARRIEALARAIPDQPLRVVRES